MFDVSPNGNDQEWRVWFWGQISLALFTPGFSIWENKQTNPYLVTLACQLNKAVLTPWKISTEWSQTFGYQSMIPVKCKLLLLLWIHFSILQEYYIEFILKTEFYFDKRMMKRPKLISGEILNHTIVRKFSVNSPPTARLHQSYPVPSYKCMTISSFMITWDWAGGHTFQQA